jgi:glucose/arabinose dehydrogenase
MFRLNYNLKSLTLGAVAFGLSLSVFAQESPKEEDFFKIFKVPAPEGTLLEVGGLAMMPNGNLAVSTRRGDVFIVANPTSQRPYFTKFASGLHEILGLAYHEGSLYMAQRGELTKLTDLNSDGKADWYETIASWPISAHYHEWRSGMVER